MRNLGGRPVGETPSSILMGIVLELLETAKGRAKVKALIKKNLYAGTNLPFITRIFQLVDEAPPPEAPEDEFDRLTDDELRLIANLSPIDIEDEAIIIPTTPVPILVERAPDPDPPKSTPVPYTHPDDASEAIGDDGDGYDERDCGGWEVVSGGERDGRPGGIPSGRRFGGRDGWGGR